MQDVSRVDAVTGEYLVLNHKVQPVPPLAIAARFAPPPGQRGTYLSVVPTVDPLSSRGGRLATSLRGVRAPFPFLVAGTAARLVDTKKSVISRLPLALGIVAVATFFLLFMMTGSLLVPLKALVLNVLTLTATFGAIVWIFQDGHFASALNITPTGTVDIFTPILMFCIAFGLSMDYEVFLLSRIKEEWDLEHDNEPRSRSASRRRVASSPPRRCCSRSFSCASRPPTSPSSRRSGSGSASRCWSTRSWSGRRSFLRSCGSRAPQLVGAAVAPPLPPALRDLGERADRPPRSAVRNQRLSAGVHGQ